MSKLTFKLEMEVKDDLHLLQKYNVPCDSCHEVKGVVFLLGGGGRHCVSCHMKQGCRALVITNVTIEDVPEPNDFEMPEMDDNQIENEYDGDVCCWGCKHCGDWVACDYKEMRYHLEDCEEFQKHILEKKKNG